MTGECGVPCIQLAPCPLAERTWTYPYCFSIALMAALGDCPSSWVLAQPCQQCGVPVQRYALWVSKGHVS